MTAWPIFFEPAGGFRGHYPFMQWKVWLTAGCGFLLASCGSSAKQHTLAPGCEPGSTFCQERQVWRCAEPGNEATLVESCSAEEECSESNGKAECKATCFPGRPTCDGDMATLCAEDGSGPEPGGEECSADGKVCEQGACVTPDCTPGELICYADDLYVCDVTAEAVALIDDCVEGEICDAELGVCDPLICETGSRACEQTRVVECNEQGTAWDVTDIDCADQGELCSEGQCEEAQCPPGAYTCMDNTAYVCPDGLGWDTLQACGGNQHCVEGAGMTSAICFYNDCLPGAPVCHMNVLKTCSQQGTYPAEGTDCGDDVCSVDACYPVICEPGETTCTDGDVYTCVMPGIDYLLTEDCASGTTCGTLAEQTICVPHACTPAEADCVGNALGECADDGLSLSSVTEDCALSGNVCDSSGTCVASTVDALGDAEDASFINNGEIIANVIDVHSSRLVTALEANLNLAQPRDLRWVIGVWNGSQYDFLVNQITTSQEGSGFFSSGALDIELEAGNRYVLGVGLVAADGVEYVYYDMPPWEAEISFGKALGGNRGFYADGYLPDYVDDYLYRIRVTTTLP